jgi:RNA-directed DNA polymerase
MSHILALKSADSLDDLASLLGFKTSGLAYILYKKTPAEKYTSFEIPKRFGGVRKISAPTDDLKLAQRRLADLLINCVAEINDANGWPDNIAHGFKKKKSIITNARRHRHKRFVFNLDLEDFFGTINFGRVRGFFISDKKFLLSSNIATFIAQIACHDNALPQGSPCSPIISNLIGHLLDIHLVQLASKYGCTYTRYADDLTFSTNKRQFPSAIAQAKLAISHEWELGKSLKKLIVKGGFRVNEAKIRMQYRDSRQEVTGLIVNQRINVRNEYRRTVRAMVHRLLTSGAFDFVRHSVGADGKSAKTKSPGTMSQLHGMLGFIDHVDKKCKPAQSELEERKGHKKKSAKKITYKHFLLFKEFYSAQKPVILCEGKTDNVYIVHAVRSLAASYPRLATINAQGKIDLNVRVYKYADSSTGSILGLSGGAGDLGNFMHMYNAELGKFKAPGKQHPVILLVDNDAAAQPIYNGIKEIVGQRPKGNEAFVHIVGNLYLCATPLKADGGQSNIENCFDEQTLQEVVGGKSFDPESKADSEKTFGKVVFAHKVIAAKANTINFGGFVPLLNNLVAAIDAHAKKFPTE